MKNKPDLHIVLVICILVIWILFSKRTESNEVISMVIWAAWVIMAHNAALHEKNKNDN